MSLDHAVRDEVLSEWEMVLRDSSLDQSPALWDGVAALPPLPMKCTLPSDDRISSTILQKSRIGPIGSLLRVSLRSEI